MQKRIVFYWAQGAEHAPEVVTRCWDAWARMNPDWEVTIHDQAAAQQACEALSIAHPPVTYQGQADIFRMYELAERGGVYIDAATVPIQPLDAWIADLSAEGFFAFHDPYRRRPVENWFLVAEAGNPIMRAWVEDTARYWQTQRRQQLARRELDPGTKGAVAHRLMQAKLALTGNAPKAKQVIEPKKRSWSVAPDGGGARPVHPYFWPHYLFDHMLSTRTDIRALWSRTPKLGSYKDLMLRHWKRDYAQMTEDDVTTLIAGSRMQKLALNGLPPKHVLDRLLNP